MKNNVFASLFIEALNSAEADNKTAQQLSDMLVQLEKKNYIRRANDVAKNSQNIPNPTRVKSNENTLQDTYRAYQAEKNRTKRITDELASARILKRKEYRNIVTERPYYFLTLEKLIAIKSDAKHVFDKENFKFSSHKNKGKLHQAKQKYERVLAEADREIQLKIKGRLEKGQKIPRSLMPNDGFKLSEEGLKRDERRKQLIAEEARAAVAHREAMSKVTLHERFTPVTLSRSTVDNSSKLPLPADGVSLSIPLPLDIQGEEKVDRLLYFQLIRQMSRDDAWRIAKSKTLSEAYRASPFQPDGVSYIHTLTYRLLLDSGVAREQALHTAKNRESAEIYLRKNIADHTVNCIWVPMILRVKTKENPPPPPVHLNLISNTKFHQLHIIDAGIHRHHVFMRSPSLQKSFKSRVSYNFYYTCAVTGQNIRALLQACHIEDYAVGADMSTDNGILLSSDCHRLLDEGLLGINPDNLTVHFKVDCIYATMFEGKKISPHRQVLNKDKLTSRWKKFIED